MSNIEEIFVIIVFIYFCFNIWSVLYFARESNTEEMVGDFDISAIAILLLFSFPICAYILISGYLDDMRLRRWRRKHRDNNYD